MNKFWKMTGSFALLATILFFAGATTAFANSRNAPDDTTPLGQGPGPVQNGDGLGLMAVDEATMHAAIAEALGMSVADFEAAVDAGATPATLAQELGIDFADVLAAIDAVHAAALQQAVSDGLITQEQADWMLSHRGGQNGQGQALNGGLGSGGQSMGRGAGNGAGNGGGGNGGAGNGGAGNGGGNNGDCIYLTS